MILAGALALGGTALVFGVAGAGPREETRSGSCGATSTIDLGCQKRRYAEIARVSGVHAAFAELKRGYRRGGFLSAACHPIVHAIGHAAVDRYGSLAAAYAHGDPFCSAGYYHGATERIVQKLDPGGFIQRANRVCSDLGGHAQHSIYHRNCAHGLGHGFMLVRGYDVRDSLATCDSLVDHWERRSCYGGVFMENEMTLGSGKKPSKYLRPTEPLYPCRVLARRYREMCFQKQTGYALFIRDDDFAAVFAMCAKVEAAFRPACHQGLGTNIAVHYLKHVSEDTQRTAITAGTCMQAPGNEARRDCIRGAVRSLINNDHRTRRARTVCAALTSGMRPGCLQAIRDKRTWPE